MACGCGTPSTGVARSTEMLLLDFLTSLEVQMTMWVVFSGTVSSTFLVPALVSLPKATAWGTAKAATPAKFKWVSLCVVSFCLALNISSWRLGVMVWPAVAMLTSAKVDRL